MANKGSRRYYIQSALTVADEEKRAQEVNSLNRVGDSFKKIVVVKDNIIPWHDENGILYIGIEKVLAGRDSNGTVRGDAEVLLCSTKVIDSQAQ